jgi:hypothetical protein
MQTRNIVRGGIAASALVVAASIMAYGGKPAAAQSTTHSIAALGHTDFVGDGSAITFIVSIPPMPNNSYVPAVTVEDTGENAQAYTIQGITPSVFRVRFASPPALGDHFRVHWIIAY